MTLDSTVDLPHGAPKQLGPCRLIAPLGAGGMGTVYLAEMAEDQPYAARGTRVAVKLLHSERAGVAREGLVRFRREAEIGRALAHRGIVRTFAAETADDSGRPYLVLEYVDGRTLAVERFLDTQIPRLMSFARSGRTGYTIPARDQQNIELHEPVPGPDLLLERGIAAWMRGDLEAARRWLQEADEAFVHLNRMSRAWVRIHRGSFELLCGDQELAREILMHSERVHREIGDRDCRASAYLALMGLRDPSTITVHEGLPVFVRAEAHVVLHRAGAGGDHLARARSLLEQMSSHLEGENLERFWRDSLTARMLLAEQARLRRGSDAEPGDSGGKPAGSV